MLDGQGHRCGSVDDKIHGSVLRFGHEGLRQAVKRMVPVEHEAEEGRAGEVKAGQVR